MTIWWARDTLRIQRAHTYFAAARKLRRGFPLFIRECENLAAQCRAWDLWLKILFRYRPLGCWYLLTMATRCALFRIGFDAVPPVSSNRLYALAKFTSRLTKAAIAQRTEDERTGTGSCAPQEPPSTKQRVVYAAVWCVAGFIFWALMTVAMPPEMR